MNTININEIYDKNINFLIGAGASFGLFPTLALNITNKDGVEQTIETLDTYFSENDYKSLNTLLFMHYYKNCIEPAISFKLDEVKNQPVINNYQQFIGTVLTILQNRNNLKKCCNIFTTNYDGCFPLSADGILSQGNSDFIINDGARGFGKRYLQAKNFNITTLQTGAFERHSIEIPQINLIHVHGSVYWKKADDNILVNYDSSLEKIELEDSVLKVLKDFSDFILNKDNKLEDLKPENFILDKSVAAKFWTEYKKLPIVNPTKWKFYETVFEEHYYQMLRLMSYELEKPNSVFITFGFSFADEHILNLVKRSLSNPKLQVFVCCFNQGEKDKLEVKFRGFKNIVFISSDTNLDFANFNKSIFTLTPPDSQNAIASTEQKGDL